MWPVQNYKKNTLDVKQHQKNNDTEQQIPLTFEWMVVSFAAKKTMKTTNIWRPIRNLADKKIRIGGWDFGRLN